MEPSTALIAAGAFLIGGAATFIATVALIGLGQARHFEKWTATETNRIAAEYGKLYVEEGMKHFEDGIKAGRRIEKIAQAHSADDDFDFFGEIEGGDDE